MNLPEFAQISEENELLRDQLRDQEVNYEAQLDELQVENADLKAEINELKAQLEAKEEGVTHHREIESRDGLVWARTVTVIAPEWEQLHGAVA